MTAPFVPTTRLSVMPGPPPVRWWTAFLAALAVVVVVSSVRYAAKVSKPGNDGAYTRSAFLRWRPQLLDLQSGVDAYRKYNYPNPPVMALILMPFTALPPLTGALAWFYLKAGLAVFVVRWAFRLVAPPGQPLSAGAMAAVVLLSLHPLLGDLSHGNVNIFIAFLVMAGLELFRTRRDAGAGLVLALAAACKVTPALFLPYLLWKRAWRAAAAMTVGIGLWLFVVPGLALGFERNVTLLEGWWDGMVRPFVIEGKVTPEHANQSVPGLVARLLTNQPSDFAYDDEDGKPVGVDFHYLADIGPAGAKWVVRGFQAVFFVAGVVLFTTPVTGRGGVRQGPRLGGELALILLGMLVFSERTWKHHAVTLVVPYALLVGVAAARPPGDRLRNVLTGVLVACAVLAVGPSLVGGDFQDLALVYGTHTAVFLLLSAAAGVVLWAERKPVAEPPPAVE